jgi:hypothetical protein
MKDSVMYKIDATEEKSTQSHLHLVMKDHMLSTIIVLIKWETQSQ